MDYLVDIFERSWERGRPFTAHEARNEKAIAADVRAMTIRLLVEGHSDPASAKRLGVSTRTYAGYIAALKDEYGVQTRFQLGHAMGSGLARRRLRRSRWRIRGELTFGSRSARGHRKTPGNISEGRPCEYMSALAS